MMLVTRPPLIYLFYCNNLSAQQVDSSSASSDDPLELFQAASIGDEEVVSSLNPTKEMMDGVEFVVTDHRSSHYWVSLSVDDRDTGNSLCQW